MRALSLVFLFIMFVRSLSENLGRMGTQYADIIWGDDTVYNLIGYCEFPDSNKKKVDMVFKFFENQFPVILGFIILVVFYSFGI
jgi:hypothetical protein